MECNPIRNLHQGYSTGGNLLLAQHHASTAVGFLVLTRYLWNIDMDTASVLARHPMTTRLVVGSRYWHGTGLVLARHLIIIRLGIGNQYWAGI